MPRNLDSDSKGVNPLLNDLARYEAPIREWLGRSTINALWFVSDPVGALRASNLGIDEALLGQLENVPQRDLTALLRLRKPAC